MANPPMSFVWFWEASTLAAEATSRGITSILGTDAGAVVDMTTLHWPPPSPKGPPTPSHHEISEQRPKRILQRSVEGREFKNEGKMNIFIRDEENGEAGRRKCGKRDEPAPNYSAARRGAVKV
jgi:hypothetical protein